MMPVAVLAPNRGEMNDHSKADRSGVLISSFRSTMRNGATLCMLENTTGTESKHVVEPSTEWAKEKENSVCQGRIKIDVV